MPGEEGNRVLLREPLLIDASATHCREEKDTTSLFVIIHAHFRSRTSYAHTCAIVSYSCAPHAVSHKRCPAHLSFRISSCRFLRMTNYFARFVTRSMPRQTPHSYCLARTMAAKVTYALTVCKKLSSPETRKRRRVPTAAVLWRLTHMRSSELTSPSRNCRIKWQWPR